MRILMDTHIVLWALADDDRLPTKAREVLLDASNEVFFSAVSVWEIAIKHALHPESITLSASEFASLCKDAGYEELDVTAEHACLLDTLTREAGAPRHKDPFDRMLIAQAKAEGMTFVTHDALLPFYHEACILFV